jgi:hypothetical protein
MWFLVRCKMVIDMSETKLANNDEGHRRPICLKE